MSDYKIPKDQATLRHVMEKILKEPGAFGFEDTVLDSEHFVIASMSQEGENCGILIPYPDTALHRIFQWALQSLIINTFVGREIDFANQTRLLPILEQAKKDFAEEMGIKLPRA